MNSLIRYIVCILGIALSGCATQYVKNTEPRSAMGSIFNQDVSYTLNAQAWAKGPECIAILPVRANGISDKAHLVSLRSVTHGRLASKGYEMVKPQRIDAWFASNANSEAKDLNLIGSEAGCDYVLTIELTTLEKSFYGFYSEVRAGGVMNLTHVPSNTVLWTGSHTVSSKGGGLPIDPVSAVMGVWSAGDNAKDEQIQRAIDELSRKLLGTLPDHEPGAERLAATKQDSLTASYQGDLDKWLETIVDADREIALQQLSTTSRVGYEERERIYSRLKLISDKPLYRRQLIRERLDNKKTELAIHEAQWLTTAEPKEAANWVLLGDANLQLKTWDEAEHAFLRALQLRPSDPRLFEKLGHVSVKMGRQERAAASFHKALTLDPESGYANYNMAVVHFNAGEFESAAESYKLAATNYLQKRDGARVKQIVLDMQDLKPFLGEKVVDEDCAQMVSGIAAIAAVK